MSSSNVPKVTVSPEGVTTPETADILNGVLTDYQVAFGGDLNITTEATPQYVLASEQTEAIALQNGFLAWVLSQFDPATAEGRYQDAIGRIYFQSRRAGTSTTVTATCYGTPGAELPKGSVARDINGHRYASTEQAFFSGSGGVDVQFACLETGAIQCPANALIYIDVAVFGWDSITNAQPGATGTDVEGRVAFETRRYNTTALNGKSSLVAIHGSIRSLEGVLDAIVLQNDTSEAKEMQGVTLAPHSIYACVEGGDQEAIATEIWKKKAAGIDTNGNTTVTVYDTTYTTPVAYTVKFQRPTIVPIKFYVYLSQSALLPSEIVSLVKRAIVAKYNEIVAGASNVIGSSVYSSKYVGCVTDINQWVDVVHLYVGKASEQADVVTLDADEFPVVTEENITVVIQGD